MDFKYSIWKQQKRKPYGRFRYTATNFIEVQQCNKEVNFCWISGRDLIIADQWKIGGGGWLQPPSSPLVPRLVRLWVCILLQIIHLNGTCHKLARINKVYVLNIRSNLGLKQVNQKNPSIAQFHFTEHCSVKSTNIAHRRVWDYCNTALKKIINTATLQIPMSPSWSD